MKICWLGLGHMGLPMATRLNDAGFEVHSFDVSPTARDAGKAAGLRVTASAADAAESADVVFTMLPSGALVHSVLIESELVRLTADDALIVDSSTIAPTEARSLGAAVASRGRDFLDAPVSGGTAGARNGTLTFMVGGVADQFERAREVLLPMASRLFHLGGIGCGQSAKAVNNMMLAMNMASVSEAVVLAERLGLDARSALEVVQVSTGDSWVLRNFYPIPGVVESAPVNNDFAPGFTTTLMRKDVELALSSACELGVTVEVTRKVADLLDRLIDAGEDQSDFSALVRIASGAVANSPVEVLP